MMSHLVVTCSASKQIWHEILSWPQLTYTPLDQEESLFEWWVKTQGQAMHSQTPA